MARNHLAEFGQAGMSNLVSEEMRQCIALATSEFTGTFLLALAAFAGTLAAEFIRDRLRQKRDARRLPNCLAGASTGENR